MGAHAIDQACSGACLSIPISQERLTRHVCRRKLAESSDDEEHFQRKEEMRLARDKARLNPVILSKFSKMFCRLRAAMYSFKGWLADIRAGFPVLNLVLRREGRPHPGEQRGMPSWESVGGLQHVVEQLKEMVLLPLLYPELFSHMRIWPPRHATITVSQISSHLLCIMCPHGPSRCFF